MDEAVESGERVGPIRYDGLKNSTDSPAPLFILSSQDPREYDRGKALMRATQIGACEQEALRDEPGKRRLYPSDIGVRRS
ncbi:MAG: hypothetical protein ABR905_17585 [Terracidiphilus sp.]